MTLLEKAEKPQTRSKGIVALIIGVLGTAGIVVFYFFGPRELRGLDVAMLFVLLAIVAYGTTQTILRGLMTAVAVYLATALAALSYPTLRPYARSFLDLLQRVGLSRPPLGSVDTSALALSFAVISVLLWIILELLFRASFPNAHLAFLGSLDRVGGALVYLVIGVTVTTLAFTAIGYGVMGRAAHERASFRPEMNQVLESYYEAQSFWFPGRPPGIYAYELNNS